MCSPFSCIVTLQVGVLPASGSQQPRGTAGGRMPEPSDMGVDALGCSLW